MMAVMRIDARTVEELCKKVPGTYPVNYNSPQQTVVAGKAGALEALKSEVASAGGRGIMLPVSGAFHSPYMDGAAAEFAEYIRGVKISDPRIKLYSDVTALPYEKNAAELLCRQINSPVRFCDIVRNMEADGVRYFIEVGAGCILSKFIKQISPTAEVFAVEKAADIAPVLEAIKNSTGGQKRCLTEKLRL